MIMTALEILKRNPKASEEDIRAGLEGNVCRCTGYQNIVQSIASAAVSKKGSA
jgi:carbon-monoxide dehydrogenase small subunit